MFNKALPHYIFGIVVFLVLVVLTGTIISFANSGKIHFDGSVDEEIFGQFGDFIAGVAGTIINFGTVIFLYINYREQRLITELQLTAAERDFDRYLEEIIPVISFKNQSFNRHTGQLIFTISNNAIYNLSFKSFEPNIITIEDLEAAITNLNKDQPISLNYTVSIEELNKKGIAPYDYSIDFEASFEDRKGTKYVQHFFTLYAQTETVVHFAPERKSVQQRL